VKYESGNFGHTLKHNFVIVLDSEIKPNESFTWIIELRAPQRLSSYFADFEMYSAQGKKCQRDFQHGALRIEIDVIPDTTLSGQNYHLSVDRIFMNEVTGNKGLIKVLCA
jgi:hypothetical protein